MSDSLKGSLPSLQIYLLISPKGQSGAEIWERESYCMEADDISKVPSLSLPVGFGQWERWWESEAGSTRMLGSPAPVSCLAATPSPYLSREPPPASCALGPGLVSKPHCPSLSVLFFVVSLHPEHSFINSLFIMLSSSYPSLNVPSVLCQDPD